MRFLLMWLLPPLVIAFIVLVAFTQEPMHSCAPTVCGH